jgi:hypothetical protein
MITPSARNWRNAWRTVWRLTWYLHQSQLAREGVDEVPRGKAASEILLQLVPQGDVTGAVDRPVGHWRLLPFTANLSLAICPHII